MGWVIAACGAFAICGAFFNWEWFMDNDKTVIVVNLFGRTGARIFYGVLGIALVVMGVLMALGIIQEASSR
jgi:hypothetical protein